MKKGVPYTEAHNIALKFEKNAFLKSYTPQQWKQYENMLDRVYTKENQFINSQLKGRKLTVSQKRELRGLLKKPFSELTQPQRKKVQNFLGIGALTGVTLETSERFLRTCQFISKKQEKKAKKLLKKRIKGKPIFTLGIVDPKSKIVEVIGLKRRKGMIVPFAKFGRKTSLY